MIKTILLLTAAGALAFQFARAGPVSAPSDTRAADEQAIRDGPFNSARF